MANYDRPDVYVEETKDADAPIEGVSTSIGNIQGIAEWGPLNKPTKVYTPAGFQKLFGGYRTDAQLAYNVDGFFRQAGEGAVYVNRIAHYNNIDDPDTVAATRASKVAKTLASGATAGYVDTVPTTFPMDLKNADDLIVDVDGDPPDTATVVVTAAVSTGVAGTWPTLFAGAETLLLEMNSGEEQTITFAVGDQTVDQVCAKINAQLKYGSAAPNGAEVEITSDIKGNNSRINITGGTGLVKLGLSGDTVIAGEDFDDIDKVTFAEVKAWCEAAFTGGSGVTVTEVAVGFRITSNTTGIASTIAVTGGSLLAGFGVPVAGADVGAAVDTLKFWGKYYGERGNNLTCEVVSTPLHPSAGAGSDITDDVVAADTHIKVSTPYGLSVGSIIKIVDTNTLLSEYKTILRIQTSIESSPPVAVHYVYFSTGTTNAYVAADSTVATNEFDVIIYEDGVEVASGGRWEGLVMDDTADNYVETIINDSDIGSELIEAVDLDAGLTSPWDEVPEAKAYALAGATNEASLLNNVDKVGSQTGKTGRYAFDIVRDASMIAVADSDEIVKHAFTAYAENRLDLFHVAAVPENKPAASAISWREESGFGSGFMALYAPWVEVLDPIGAGKSPMLKISPVGDVMGLYARVDAIPPPEGGVASAPAGENDFGRLREVYGLEYEFEPGEQGSLNVAGINCIIKTTNGILVNGCRTCSSDKKWRYVNVRRAFIYMEQSIARGTRWAVHRNNDFRLWDKLRSRVESFLSGFWKDGGLYGDTEEDAFSVKVGIDDGVMTLDDKDNGLVIGEIGAAKQTPGEFIIWRFSQKEGTPTTISE